MDCVARCVALNRYHGDAVVLKKLLLEKGARRKRQETMDRFMNEMIIMGHLK